MAEKPERQFYLEGAAPDSVLGLSGGGAALRKDGTIDIAKLNPGQLEELERMAATEGNPVVESEPRNIK